MYYAPGEQINAARHIARSAQRQIKDKTGMRVTILLCPRESAQNTPEAMLGIIAPALGLKTECFRLRSRTRDIVELRFLAAMFLRRHFPHITLHQIAELYGGHDHTSIISGLARANNLIYTGDTRFINKYNTVEKAVDLWLKKAA